MTLCALAVRGEIDAAADEREANVLRVAAMLARPRHPSAACRLREVAAPWFERHPEARREAGELVRLGWLVGLPRFRALLDARLDET